MPSNKFAVAYPIGTHILWQNRKEDSHTWHPGVVVEPKRKTIFDPSVWFLLDKDTDGISRYISRKYQHLIKKEV